MIGAKQVQERCKSLMLITPPEQLEEACPAIRGRSMGSGAGEGTVTRRVAQSPVNDHPDQHSFQQILFGRWSIRVRRRRFRS